MMGQMPEDSTEGGEETTATIPMDIAGAAKPGDTIRLTVVSVDDGQVTVKAAAQNDNMKPERSTIKDAAALFNEGGE